MPASAPRQDPATTHILFSLLGGPRLDKHVPQRSPTLSHEVSLQREQNNYEKNYEGDVAIQFSAFLFPSACVFVWNLFKWAPAR